MLKRFHPVLFALLLIPSVLIAQDAAVFTPEQQQAIESIVRNYLKAHPELTQTAIAPKQAQASNENPIITYQQELFHDPHSPSVHFPDPQAAVVVEFFDYQCGHCKTMRSVMEEVLEKTHRVTFIFKELPIFGDQSAFAAKAALAANKQGKYWELHQAMLVSDGGLPPEDVLAMAERVGLDVEQLKQDMNDPAIEAQLKDNSELAKHLKVEGTPTLFLANSTLSRIEIIPGAVSTHNLIQSINEVIAPEQIPNSP